MVLRVITRGWSPAQAAAAAGVSELGALLSAALLDLVMLAYAGGRGESRSRRSE